MDAHRLARHITANLPAPDAAVLSAAGQIADSLRALGDRVPFDDWLIVGGSLARGEPSLARTTDSTPTLLSDIDLLYVHSSDQPCTAVSELRAMAEKGSAA